MIDYDKKYKDMTEGLFACIDDITNEYPEANSFEKIVIALRREDADYEGIQRKLGMPSKKLIRAALVKWAPELIDNSKSIKQKYADEYRRLNNILRNSDKKSLSINGNTVNYNEEDHKIYYNGCPMTWYVYVKNQDIISKIQATTK